MAIYAFSDLHGHLEVYKRIKEFVDPSDALICLGDCGDRGPEPWKAIETVADDPQVLYLMGNHEDMLLTSMAYNLKRKYTPSCKYGNPPYHTMFANGGTGTFEEWEDLPLGKKEYWFDFLSKLHYVCVCNSGGKNLYLSHAGPTQLLYQNATNEEILWDRNYSDEWPDGHDDTIIVHGHTPCWHLPGHRDWEPEDGAVWYANGHKVCIDMGTVLTGTVCLLDLNTFNQFLFNKDGLISSIAKIK